MLEPLKRLLSASGPERFMKTGVVDPPNVVQSEQGRYYVGRTGLLPVPGGQEALALLRMPEDSPRRAFVVSITVTSNRGRRALFCLGAESPAEMRRSLKVASAYRGAPDEPQAAILLAVGPSVPVTAGVSAFELLLVGGDTMVLEQQGRLILEPGEAIGIGFEPVEDADEIDVALGWWEEPLG